jgi:MOSC domain-containing protein YiiM
MTGVIVQVNISRGGVPKLPVPAAEVGEHGIAGDGHDEPPHIHGGPERALCLFALERIEALAAEGHPIFAGATGENITTRGLDWERVVPGVRLRLGGEVLIEITRYTTPCRTNARWFLGGDFNRMHQAVHPGWSRVYARVLAGGVIRPGDPIELLGAVPAGDQGPNA